MQQTGLFVTDIEIPKRALFKASEVCEIASVQPYVLRSWESEFPDLGVPRGGGGARVYRRADLERVLRIKQLVFGDGLTLAGARRRIEEEAPPVLDDAAPIRELLGRNAKERLAEVKRGLIGILEMLDGTTKDHNGTHHEGTKAHHEGTKTGPRRHEDTKANHEGTKTRRHDGTKIRRLHARSARSSKPRHRQPAKTRSR